MNITPILFEEAVSDVPKFMNFSFFLYSQAAFPFHLLTGLPLFAYYWAPSVLFL